MANDFLNCLTFSPIRYISRYHVRVDARAITFKRFNGRVLPCLRHFLLITHGLFNGDTVVFPPGGDFK